jgi:hypothetical protein
VTPTTFSAVARALGDACGPLGLRTPAYRTPPKTRGADRTLTRLPDGGSVVAVRILVRGDTAVLTDMVEGTLAGNGRALDDEVGLELMQAAMAALIADEQRRAS